ncbi:uncharacterized protein LOC130824470 isoform X2 [Amaranthus tricolor]|nr:uncharacterized protein LOC130824470 isoform X2 [Amaranthus tricolor]
MENYTEIKLKRKDLEEFNYDFSDFSLSAPARKIRRLDVDLSPLMEEEADVQMGLEQGLPERTVINGLGNRLKPVIVEELPSVPENDEKAIVLFQPTNNNPLVCSQGMFSVDANLISCFKNQVFWGSKLNSSRLKDEDDDNVQDDVCKAVIPWVPSHTLNPLPEIQTEVSDSMEADEIEASTMEIENANATNVGYNNLYRHNDGMQHQMHQQLHC